MTTTDTDQAALNLANQLHLQQDSVPKTGVERYLSRTTTLEPSKVLDHAVAAGWLKISNDGLRVSPGTTHPPAYLQ